MRTRYEIIIIWQLNGFAYVKIIVPQLQLLLKRETYLSSVENDDTLCKITIIFETQPFYSYKNNCSTVPKWY